MKTCFKCQQKKPIHDFYKHKGMRDGRLNKCKECNKRDVRENRARRIDYYREYDAKRAMRRDRVEARAAYQSTYSGKESASKAKAKWAFGNPIKKGASTIVGNAVRSGRIIKPSECSDCGDSCGRIHGHHDDYAKPLEVRWLCPACHMKWHKINGPGLNGD